MRKVLSGLVLAILSSTGTWASDPGAPLDCTDWQFLEPGLTCGEWQPTLAANSQTMAFDNLGRLLSVRAVAETFPCDQSMYHSQSLEITVMDGLGTVVPIARLAARCESNFTIRFASFDGLLEFDRTSGRLLLGVRSQCAPVGGAYCDMTDWTASIGGFAPLFEELQSYAPGPSGVSFSVPTFPDGMAGADRFDTYYGSLSGPKDFSQSQPLRCNYPTTTPKPGDYLEAGVVPDPPSRQGYYYVTAATYQGETRYGRKRENGILNGRDPAGLPACVETRVATKQ